MYDENNDYGAIIELDMEYPTMARIKHKDLPFLPQRKEINHDLPFIHQRNGINEDSPQRKEINKDLPLPQQKKVNKVHKLVTTLGDKKKIRSTYICIKTSTRSWIETKESTQSNSL